MPSLRDRIELLALLRGRDPASFDDARRAALLAAAEREGVAGRLAPRHPSFASGAESARLTSILAGSTTRRAVEALEAAGIAVAVLKGAAIAGLAWDEPSQRPQADVDLLVRPRDLARAGEVLREAGVAGETKIEGKAHHHATLAASGGAMVEMHKELTSDLPLRVSAAELLERRLRVKAADGELPTLSLEDTAAYVALHAALHALERLSWVLDLDGLARLQPVDWELAARRARAWGAAVPVAIAWDAAIRWLRAPIPRAAMATLGVPMRRRLASEALRGAARLAGERITGPLTISYRLSLLPGLSALPSQLARKLADRKETAAYR